MFSNHFGNYIKKFTSWTEIKIGRYMYNENKNIVPICHGYPQNVMIYSQDIKAFTLFLRPYLPGQKSKLILTSLS